MGAMSRRKGATAERAVVAFLRNLGVMIVMRGSLLRLTRRRYANHTQRLYVVNRSDLRQAPPAPPEAVQPQPEEVR